MASKGYFQQLKAGAHIHLMGICGTAMGSLAGLLVDRGFKVTGSDQNVYPPMSTQLKDLGIEIMEGYKKENLQPRPDFVVVGNVISKHYEEAAALLETDIPFTSLPVMIGQAIIEDRHSLVVAGTHGKTTTTSMATWLAECCGFEPGYLIGGIPNNFKKSYRLPQKDLFVIEGDEYDTAFFDKVPKFNHYRPRTVIFTSCEFDHADIYDSIDDIRKAFSHLMEIIPKDGLLVYYAEEDEVSSLAKKYTGKKIGYGISRGDIRARDIRVEPGKATYFKLEGDVPETWKDVEFCLPLFGDYNLLNALSTLAVAIHYDWPLGRCKEALETFLSVKRRQELLGEPGGIKVIEDFAHHPTAVKKTIQGVRRQFPDGRLFAVFEPRSATSRRKVFQKAYEEAFLQADYTLIAKPYDQSKIPEEERFSTDALISSLKAHNKEALGADSVEEIIESIRKEAQSGDTVLIMSNGGFDGIYVKLLSVLDV